MPTKSHDFSNVKDTDLNTGINQQYGLALF
jgi:hypothetical protein